MVLVRPGEMGIGPVSPAQSEVGEASHRSCWGRGFGRTWALTRWCRGKERKF